MTIMKFKLIFSLCLYICVFVCALKNNELHIINNPSDVALYNIEALSDNETSGDACFTYLSETRIEEHASSGSRTVVLVYGCTSGKSGICQKGNLYIYYLSNGTQAEEDKRELSTCF